eukprot:6170744-Prymnesium_polylepis.1
MRVKGALEGAGLTTWVDDGTHADPHDRIADGIDRSNVIVALLTAQYMIKVLGRGPNGSDDVCKYELDYALWRKGVVRVIPVIVDRGSAATSQWEGIFAERLASLVRTAAARCCARCRGCAHGVWKIASRQALFFSRAEVGQKRRCRHAVPARVRPAGADQPVRQRLVCRQPAAARARALQPVAPVAPRPRQGRLVARLALVVRSSAAESKPAHPRPTVQRARRACAQPSHDLLNAHPHTRSPGPALPLHSPRPPSDRDAAASSGPVPQVDLVSLQPPHAPVVGRRQRHRPRARVRAGGGARGAHAVPPPPPPLVLPEPPPHAATMAALRWGHASKSSKLGARVQV